MKPILIALTLSALAATALTGCGSKAEEPATAPPAAGNAAPPPMPPAAGQPKSDTGG